MHRPSLQTAAVLLVVFLLAKAPWLQGSLWEARADTVSETGATRVECVLPGRIRPLGSTPYVTPGRTIKTTKKECKTRGGRAVTPSEPATEMPSGEPAEEDVRVSPEGGKATD